MMKETASMVLLFIFTGVFSGAMSITATVVFITIGGGLIYIAWSEEKKVILQKKELSIMRKKRLARSNLN